jgi:hypothetical protein
MSKLRSLIKEDDFNDDATLYNLSLGGLGETKSLEDGPYIFGAMFHVKHSKQ